VQKCRRRRCYHGSAPRSSLRKLDNPCTRSDPLEAKATSGLQLVVLRTVVVCRRIGPVATLTSLSGQLGSTQYQLLYSSLTSLDDSPRPGPPWSWTWSSAAVIVRQKTFEHVRRRLSVFWATTTATRSGLAPTSSIRPSRDPPQSVSASEPEDRLKPSWPPVRRRTPA
jgi:hypothetical protein